MEVVKVKIMKKIVTLFLLLLSSLMYAQDAPRTGGGELSTARYGIRYVQLGRNIQEVWNDMNSEYRKFGFAGAPPMSNCSPITPTFGNHIVKQCTFEDFILAGERLGISILTWNDLIIQIKIPSEFNEKLADTTSDEYINIVRTGISKKYSKEPVIESKQQNLDENVNDEEDDYFIKCKKIYLLSTKEIPSAAKRIRNNGISPRDHESGREICSLNFVWNDYFDVRNFPKLHAEQLEIQKKLEEIKNNKKKTCINCMRKVFIERWGEDGSDNVIRMVYTKRDSTNAYKFYAFEVSNDAALNELKNAKTNSNKEIESSVYKK